jgi:ketosteroid isomerase-like protein
MRDATRCLLLSIALSVLACKPAAPPAAGSTDEATAAAVRRVGEAYLAALRAGDIDAALSQWADSMAVLPPNEPALRGREAFRVWGEAFMKQVKVVDAKFTESEVAASGDLATERVAFVLTLQPMAGGAPMTEIGKGLHVYRRQADGAWRLIMDIWSADAPAKP